MYMYLLTLYFSTFYYKNSINLLHSHHMFMHVNWCKIFNPDPDPNVDILSKTNIKALFMDLKKYLLLIHAHDTYN